MSINTSYAVLLRKIRFRNTSNIIDILTDNRGRVSLIAKGARREKSEFFGCIDYCSLLEMVYIDKPESMGVLTGCDISDYYSGIHASGLRLGAGMLFVRLLREFAESREAEEGLFSVCRAFFSCLDSCEEDRVSETYISYVCALLEKAGFRPDCSCCSVCGINAAESPSMVFDPEEIQIVCPKCLCEKKEKKYLELSAKTCIIIQNMQNAEPADACKPGAHDVQEVERFFLAFAGSVLGKDLHSLSMRAYHSIAEVGTL